MTKTDDRSHIGELRILWDMGFLKSLIWRAGFFCLALIFTLAALEMNAFAYTDPGTGALIWQIVAAGFVGAAFYFRRFLNWFKATRANRKHPPSEPPLENTQDDHDR